ncbi:MULTISPECIES: hypothetical protein [Amycolatopsis]|uniref:Uncharacterized protein n=1 Tax=Amycolatopsis bullii TaxID=941987 RepID=A0ABQ3KE25_9PSEU|nr:hypothetical protein [Amycolatopsis bullii]GHG16725.1 hypothetical protein GCM10017567_38650 [Amycolatopsis bullii]
MANEFPAPTVVDALPRRFRGLIVELLADRAPDLLAALEKQEKPTLAQQEAVLEVLVDAFVDHLGPWDEPTPRGALIDDALGAFLEQWPAEDLTDE